MYIQNLILTLFETGSLLKLFLEAMGYFSLDDLKAKLSDEGLSSDEIKFVISSFRKTDEVNVYEIRLPEINKIEAHGLLDRFKVACAKMGILSDFLEDEKKIQQLRFKA